MSLLPEFYERHWFKTEEQTRWWWDGLEAQLQVSEAGFSLGCRSTCRMLKPKGPTRDLGPFRADLKCCTFGPYLPSFTVGALLAELASGAAVRAGRLEAFLQAGRCTPLGVFSPIKSTSICETGKRVQDRCGFLDENAACTIWGHRPSPCAGYVCQSSRGRLGLEEWKRWEWRLAEFEWSLAHLAMLELGYTLDEKDHTFYDLEQAREFYARAYTAARSIDIRSLGSPSSLRQESTGA